MYERLLGSLLVYPQAAMAMGQGLIYLGGVMAVLGLGVGRLGRRVAHVFERIGAVPPDVMSGFPWWLRMLIPETAWGWIGVALVLVIGAYLVYLGKWAKKMHM